MYQAMYSTTARRVPARVGHALVSMSSPFSEEKNDSASALSLLGPPDRQRDLVLLGEGGANPAKNRHVIERPSIVLAWRGSGLRDAATASKAKAAAAVVPVRGCG